MAMASYSIREMSLFSGIKAHTIRIWGKRYNLFSPQRTDSNIRRYSDDDLRLLLNVSLLLSTGHKISKIAELSVSEICSRVNSMDEYQQASLLPGILFESVLHFNESEFSGKIDDTINEKGFEWTYENMLVPFQRKLGLLWQTGAVPSLQVHFASNIIREKIVKHTASLPQSNTGDKSILFFLPDGELHELGLLYFNYIARQEGFNTLYLGQTVPVEALVELKNRSDIAGIVVSITSSMNNENLKAMFAMLRENFPNAGLMVTGLQVELNHGLVPKEVKILKSARSFRVYLGKFKNGKGL